MSCEMNNSRFLVGIIIASLYADDMFLLKNMFYVQIEKCLFSKVPLLLPFLYFLKISSTLTEYLNKMNCVLM